MIRDSNSPCAEGTRPADGTRGRAPVVVLSNEVFSDNDEMSQVSVSHSALCALLALTILQGSTAGQLYELTQSKLTTKARCL